MNVSVYIYGKLGGEYTQYPDDYTRTLFLEFEKKLKSPSQLMIHRETDLIYYAYIRRLSGNGKYIGICFVWNCVMCTDIVTLCKICEDNITNWVVNGNILEFAENGDIISRVEKLYTVSSEFKRLSESLSIQIELANLPFSELPSVNYALSLDESKNFILDSGNEVIIDAVKEYSNIYVYSDSSFENLKGYSDKLRWLNQENVKKQKEIQQLRARKTVLYVLVASLAGVGLLLIANFVQTSKIRMEKDEYERFKKENIEFKKENVQLKNANTFLSDNYNRQSNRISVLLSDSISNQRLIKSLINNYDSIKEEHTDLLHLFEKSVNYAPLWIYDIGITNTNYNGFVETKRGNVIYSSNTMYLCPVIDYVGFKSLNNKTFYVKFYDSWGNLSQGKSSPSNYSYYQTININQGIQTNVSVGGWGSDKKGHWTTGTYKVEIWYQGKCLKTKDFRVY